MKSRTPILDSYRLMYTNMPTEPWVESYIDRERKTIYINRAAWPGAKVVRLLVEKKPRQH